MSAAIYDWSLAPRALLEDHARESCLYWRTPGPGPKPLGTAVCRTLDLLCKAARRVRTLADVDAEIVELSRQLATLPRPIDLDEVSRLRKRIEECCREPTAEASPPAAGGELDAPAELAAACPSCAELRARLVNIYHLTLTGDGEGDPGVVRAIRAASGPGAPAPAPGGQDA